MDNKSKAVEANEAITAIYAELAVAEYELLNAHFIALSRLPPAEKKRYMAAWRSVCNAQAIIRKVFMSCDN